MNRYVQSAASQEVPPPYRFPGVTVNAFVWEARLDRVQAYCDRFFNLGEPKDRGFVYGAAGIWPYALLLFIDYPVMIRAGREDENIGDEVSYSDRGVVSQREVFVALPVVRRGTAPGSLLTNSALEWVLPFIVVGNPMSAVCGREMLGLEKLLADISLDESDFPDSFRGSVRLPGWDPSAPEKGQQMLPFLEVTTMPTVPSPRGSSYETSPWTLLRSRPAGGLIDAAMNVAGYVDTLSDGVMPTAMRTISLKQFRDADDPSRAMYQALVSCRSKYSNIRNFKFFNEKDVKVDFRSKSSFAEILNLVGPEPGRQPQPSQNRHDGFQPVAAYRFNADIKFDDMRTLHTFSVDREGGLSRSPSSSDLTAPWLRPWKGFFGPMRRP